MDQSFGFQQGGLGDLFGDASGTQQHRQDASSQFHSYQAQGSNQGLGSVQLPGNTVLLDATQATNLGNFGWIQGGSSSSSNLHQTSTMGGQQDQQQSGFLRYQPLEAQIAQLGQAAGHSASKQATNGMLNLQGGNATQGMSNSMSNPMGATNSMSNTMSNNMSNVSGSNNMSSNMSSNMPGMNGVNSMSGNVSGMANNISNMPNNMSGNMSGMNNMSQVGQAGQTFNRLQLPVMGQIGNQQSQETHINTPAPETNTQHSQSGSKSSSSNKPKKPPQGLLSQTAIVPRHKASGGRTSRKPIVLDREMLEPYFNVTQSTAAQKLGICQSALKKACRRLGIMKWPFSDKDLPREPTVNPLLSELNKNGQQQNNNMSNMNNMGNVNQQLMENQPLGNNTSTLQNLNNGLSGQSSHAGGMDLQGLGRFPGSTNLLGNHPQLMKPNSMSIGNQGLSNQGLSNQGLSNQGLSNQGLSNQGLSNQALNSQGLSSQGLSSQGATNNLMQQNLNTGLINNQLQQAMTGNNLGQQNFNVVNSTSSIGVRNQMPQTNTLNSNLNSNLNNTTNLSWDNSQGGAFAATSWTQNPTSSNKLSSAQGLSNQGLSGQGLSNQGLSNHSLSNQGLGNQGLSNQGLGNWGATQADNFGLGSYIGQQGLAQQGDLNLALVGLGAQGLGQNLSYDPR